MLITLNTLRKSVRMAHLQKVLFPSRPFSFVFQRLQFRNAYKRGRKSLDPHVKLSRRNFITYSFTHRKGHFTQENRQFCTLVKGEILDEKEAENALSQEIESLSQIDLSSNDLINTFQNLRSAYGRLRRKKRFQDLEKDLEEFVKSDSFVNYCNALEEKLPLLTAQELKVLLDLCVFKLPPTCALLQKIYHLIIEKINDYTSTEGLSIFLILSQPLQKNNTKVKVLQLVCKQYFESKLFSPSMEEIDYNSIAFFCNSPNLQLPIKKKLMNLLVKNFKTKHFKLHISGLCQTIGAFKDPGLVSYFKPEMLEVLKQRISEKPSFSSTVNLLAGYKELLLRGCEYDQSFLDSLLEISSDQKNVIPSVELCESFLTVGHNCLPLVKHSEELFSSREFTLKAKRLCYQMTKILATVYYHPFGYAGDDAVHKECLEKLDAFNYKMGSLSNFVNWCLFVTTLGTPRKFEYINQLFTHLTENFVNFKQVSVLPACEGILTLNAFARRHFPTEVSELPKEILQQCFDAQKREILKRTLNKKLRTLFNGKIFEFCTTSHDQFINLAVVLNQDNQNERASDSETDLLDENLKIEDIKRSPTSELILFQVYTGDSPCEFRNSPELPGYMQLLKQTYEPLNCKVCFLHLRVLNSLNQSGLQDYLIAKIGSLNYV